MKARHTQGAPVATSDSREQILYLLKTHGPLSAGAIADHLGITAVGARQHLHQLAEQGLLQRFDRAEKVGRPASYWALTEKAQQRFPDRHGDLTVKLIESVREVFGPQGLDTLIARREQESLAEYLDALRNCATLGARVRKLAQLRDREGYMAQAVQEQRGIWLLLENHCPICAAARHCHNFCRSELEIFRQCLPEARVERCEYLLDGARRCAYRISAQQT
ncbi:metalloregulator ArsR/SmtB family transcription factor [Microbulbifer sp. HZ11]|uniref:helix-turn-helix transcriptional regulator n=1 Tax=Microbulbifer sp. HZ11 TaxID=1453501 RepID=UPI00068B638B|nr:metalloregulator ArsR/SmtB family transcription factor [Microbulbifer sp. HZ11]